MVHRNAVHPFLNVLHHAATGVCLVAFLALHAAGCGGFGAGNPIINITTGATNVEVITDVNQDQNVEVNQDTDAGDGAANECEADADCDDGLFCTGIETCSGGVCQATNRPCPGLTCDEANNACVACVNNRECDDANACTDDACVNGACQNINNTDPCDDGLFCTANDACSGGVCVGSGDACPDQTCDESNNACVTVIEQCTASSTFSTGDEGWTIFGDAQGGSGVPDFVSTGGNTGGHISATDDGLGGVWYFQAPLKFHGNFIRAAGLSLTFDLKQSSTLNQFDASDVILVGGGLTIVADTANNPGLGWTSYSVALDTSAGWTLDALDGTVATADHIRTVLGDLQDLRIRGEYVDAPDDGQLDNVVLNTDCDGGGVVCEVDSDCDDDLFCNGVEICDNGACSSPGDPCFQGDTCDEITNACLPPVELCPVSSTFSAGSEDWTVFGDAQGGSGVPDFVATGGNPGGHISATDDGLGDTWFFQAPPKFHGNFSGAAGMNLTFDLKQSGISSQFDANDVILVGGGLTIVADTANNPGLDWTSYSVALDTSTGWTIDVLGGTAATAAQILTVLSDLQSIQIRGEFLDGPDNAQLDNVALNTTCDNG